MCGVGSVYLKSALLIEIRPSARVRTLEILIHKLFKVLGRAVCSLKGFCMSVLLRVCRIFSTYGSVQYYMVGMEVHNCHLCAIGGRGSLAGRGFSYGREGVS